MSVLTGLNNLEGNEDLSALFMKLWHPDFHLGNHLDAFRSQETAAKRIDFVYNDLRRTKLFHRLQEDRKSDELSNMFREKGDRLFEAANYQMAHKEYVNAIAGAKTGRILGLGYAQRSMVLFQSGMYQQCIEDIDRARTLGLPRNQTTKLLQRRSEASSKTSAQSLFHQVLPKIAPNHQNALIKNASNSIRIVTNDAAFGTHIVATKNIKVGDVLAVEKPYVCVATSLGLMDHCMECGELCFTLIPCNRCTHAMYCGEACRRRAIEDGHEYECVLVKTVAAFVPHDVGIHFQLALKVALKLRDRFKDVDKMTKSHHKQPADSSYDSDYRDVFNLASSISYTLPLRQYYVAMQVAQIAHLLKRHTAFFSESGTSRSEDTFKEIMHRIVFVSNANIQNVREVESGLYFVELTTKIIANGLYAVTQRFAHACVPNVVLVAHGNTLVARALRPIKPGERCTVTKFIDECHRIPIKQRRKYLFVTGNRSCSCELCMGSWKLDMVDLDSELPELVRMGSVVESVSNTKNMADIEALIEYLPPLLYKAGSDGHEENVNFTTFIILRNALHMLGNNRMHSLNIAPNKTVLQ